MGIDIDALQAVACGLGHDTDQARVTKRWLVHVLLELRMARGQDAGLVPQGHYPLLDTTRR